MTLIEIIQELCAIGLLALITLGSFRLKQQLKGYH